MIRRTWNAATTRQHALISETQRSLMKRSKSTASANRRPSYQRRLINAGDLRSWAAVRDFLIEVFPGCEKEPTGGREVVRVAGKVLAYLAVSERSRPGGEPGNEEFVIVRIDPDRREHLLELNPEAFFVTPHYRRYPGVIVRLSTVDQKQLRDLLVDAWRLVAPKRLVRDWDAELLLAATEKTDLKIQ
jgi:hypothetical protein